MEKIIKDCGDCPYLTIDWGEYCCTEGGDRKEIGPEDELIESTPQWCPLRKEPIILKFVE